MKVISGIYKNRQLKTPKGDRTRPTSSKVRGSVFDILQGEIEGARFLDLFAGSGSMGIEALSRGAKSAVFVEKDRNAANCIRENLNALGIDAKLLQLDAQVAVKKLQKLGEVFDLIYVDPPYALDVGPLLEKLPTLLAENGLILLEQGKRAKISADHLELVDERHFGDTTLFSYKKFNRI